MFSANESVRRHLPVVAALLLLTVLVASPAGVFGYSRYGPRPEGPVGLRRPEISQQFLLEEGEGFKSVRMWLDGREVVPLVDAGAGLVSYVPPEPLAAGAHRVRLEVTVSHPDPRYSWPPLVSEFTFWVAADALLELPGPTPAAHEAMARLCAHRAAAALGPVAFSAPLAAAAQRHADYQAASGKLSHLQSPGAALFFGETAFDRALYFCFRGQGVAEVIAAAGSTEEAVDGWMATLYHRLPLLAPGTADFGYGIASSPVLKTIHVLKTGFGGAAPAEVAWPAPGAVGVPCSWSGNEAPDPLRLYPGISGPLGYTITLTFAGAKGAPTLSTGRLRDPNGVDVAVMSYSPHPHGNDAHLQDTVALIPRRPLLPGVTYRVELSGTVDLGRGNEAYHRSWSFTTAAEGRAFWDLPPTNPAYEAVSLLVARGVVNGYEDGSFRPSAEVTRAEFSKLLAAAAAWPLEPGTRLVFTDVAGHWAAMQGFLQAAVRAGAVDGFPDGTFRPESAVTRAQAVKMAAAAAGLPPAGVAPYGDVSVLGWYAGWVAAAHSAGLIGPGAAWPQFTSSSFAGERPMTRAEAATLVANLLRLP